PSVQTGAVIAELVKDLLHFERERQDLYEHRRLDLSATEIELVFSPVEDVVPEPRLAVALHLRQVEIRSAPSLEQMLRVVEDVEPEVEHRAGDRHAVDQQMPLHEVPASR